LDEVLEADVIAHVRDASHAESAAQKVDVLKVLEELGVEPGRDRPFVEILNKIDLLAPEARRGLLQANHRANGPIPISALTGEGVEPLLWRFESALNAANIAFRLELEPSDGEGLAWVYRHGHVLERKDGAKAIRLRLSIDPQQIVRFESRFGGKLLPA
jgi:GTP-binding protein HflX